MEKKSSDSSLEEHDTTPNDAIDNSHAFVIRIWLEENDLETAPILWRGHITHVLDQRKFYFQELSGVADFISPYIEAWHRKDSS